MIKWYWYVFIMLYMIMSVTSVGMHTANYGEFQPGVLTTKLLAKHVDKILLDVEESKKFLPEGKEYVVTGNPVRQEIFTEDREAAREFYGIGDRLCILSFGGSLGAQRLNEAVSDLMAWHLSERDFVHIHGSGSYYGPSYYTDMLKEKGIDAHEHKNLIIREYINDMPRCLAAADLVISRAGAGAAFEIIALKKPALFIPLETQTRGDQIENAEYFFKKGLCRIAREADLPRLEEKIDALVQDSVLPLRVAERGFCAGNDVILRSLTAYLK